MKLPMQDQANPDVFGSLTPSARQVKWRWPVEFPLCPASVSEAALEEYGARLAFGSVFSRNEFSQSFVVHYGKAQDGLVVITRLADNPIKDWAVAHISMRDGFFYHRSEATFYELQGALMRFCELTGQSYDDPWDNYC